MRLLLLATASLLLACPPKKPPATDACVKECVARNQMRAVSAEQIEADCKRECESEASGKN